MKQGECSQPGVVVGGADADGFFGPDCRQIRLLDGRIDY
jgi:hypothetical protein